MVLIRPNMLITDANSLPVIVAPSQVAPKPFRPGYFWLVGSDNRSSRQLNSPVRLGRSPRTGYDDYSGHMFASVRKFASYL